jgi:hypothetical protein
MADSRRKRGTERSTVTDYNGTLNGVCDRRANDD